ncbi:hypothetical protein [Streptomyces niveus]|uniref:hypothetical protein n=1 Tax=Streptomyces niveus TaxID=193462 RepID=UPI00341358F7
MIRVTIEWRQQRTVRGKTSQNLLEAETEEFEWPDSVASSIASLLEAHPKLTFSGMEDFGQGGCVLYPQTLRCKAYGDCRHHHIESVREWVESRVGELKTGESVDFTGGALKYVSVQVEALPEAQDEDDDTEDEPDPTPAEPETYTKRSAWSSEVRPIGEPVTHAEDSAATLAEHGTLVRARPHFKVPASRSSLTTVRSAFTFEARVISTCGDGLVLVKWTWETDDAPWSRTGAFKPEELHNAYSCECAACKGETGIREFEGA